MTLIKSISGIRGTVGGAQAENLTPPDVVKFTTAYARLIAERNPGKKLTIVVGRDARISGEMVSDLVEGTLLACGADVIKRRALHHAGHRDGRHHQAGRRRHHHHRVAQPASVERPEAAQLRRRIPHRRRGQARAGDGRGGGLRVPRRGRHRACASREPFNRTHIEQVLALPLVDAEASANAASRWSWTP